MAETPTGQVAVRYLDDEHLEVVVDGKVVASADHDEHGWSGMDAVVATAYAVARALGGQVDVDEGDVEQPTESAVPDEALGTSPQAEWHRDAHGLDPGQVC